MGQRAPGDVPPFQALMTTLAADDRHQGFVVCYRSIFDLVRDFLADDALQERGRVLE